jgi:hypothetical protein
MQRENPTSVLRRGLSRMPRWQKGVIVAMIVLIALTCLATCLVLATFLA